jgi:hypothetical protein
MFMRTAEQCRAKALEMDILALSGDTAETTVEYEQLAAHWRHLANQAKWQDTYKT